MNDTPIENKDPEETDKDEVYAAKIPWKRVEWTMDWVVNKHLFPDKPDYEEMFQVDSALAVLLAHEVVFLNSFWWEDTWPKEAQRKTSLNVNANDVFAWGCSDAVDLDHSEIESLYKHWKQDPENGPTVWCIKKRGEMPQAPVLRSIVKGGIWDVEKLKADCKVNHYDTVSSMYSEAKYNAYKNWCVEKGTEALPYDAGWWSGWKEYTQENPNWSKSNWFKEAHAKVDEFKNNWNKPK